jgi:DNA polymerase-3 subunit alpha
LEFEKKQRLAFEKEMLGLYVSDHPLMGAERSLAKRTDCSLVDLVELEDGAMRSIGGVVTNLQRKWTRKGDLMAVFVLEDLQSSVEVMVFPKSMAEHGHKLVDDAVVIVSGRVDKRDDLPKFMARDVELFEPMADGTPPLRLAVSVAQLSDETIDRLKSLFSEFPGESEIFLHVGDRHVVRLPDQYSVDIGGGLVGELRVLLGPEALLV